MHELLNALDRLYLKKRKGGDKVLYICMPRHYVHYGERLGKIFSCEVYWNDHNEMQIIMAKDIELC